MPVVAFAILTVLPAGIHPMAVSLLGILTGLGILIWLLTGYEWIRSRSTLGGVVIQLSPLLTRIASAMVALMLVALAFAIAPDSNLDGLAGGVGSAAAAIMVLCLVIGAVPQTQTWGRRNAQSSLSRPK